MARLIIEDCAHERFGATHVCPVSHKSRIIVDLVDLPSYIIEAAARAVEWVDGWNVDASSQEVAEAALKAGLAQLAEGDNE